METGCRGQLGGVPGRNQTRYWTPWRESLRKGILIPSPKLSNLPTLATSSHRTWGISTGQISTISKLRYRRHKFQKPYFCFSNGVVFVFLGGGRRTVHDWGLNVPIISKTALCLRTWANALGQHISPIPTYTRPQIG